MENIIIPIKIPTSLLITLNETEQELQEHFQLAIAITLFKEQKLTIGKAIQLSGLTRFEFERKLAKYEISISNQNFDQIMQDVEKIKEV